MIVLLAVRQSVAFKEVTRPNLFLALSAREVLRVPESTKSSYHLKTENTAFDVCTLKHLRGMCFETR